ncbi:MAG: LysR family transcriptional regulator [Dehalococcoidia bacterium]|nr:LysR family transcriptional regulator [Dehalococcoidia bacterium]
MDIGQIEAFVQVAALQSFSKAAEALFLTQPSVTARIQGLEREMQETLFERSGRGVRLTDAGQVFLPYAQKILQQLKEGRESIEGLRRSEIGFLRLGAAPALGTYVLPKVLKAFAEKYPNVEVTVKTGHSEQVMQLLLSDAVQIGLARTMIHPELETVPLYDDEVILVTNPSHRFCQHRMTRIEEVTRENLIFWDRTSSYYALIQGLFYQAGLPPKTTMEMDNVEATKKMVEEGLGIAFLPRVSVEREIEHGLLCEVLVTDIPAATREIAMMARRNRRPSRAVSAFIETVHTLYLLDSGAPARPAGRAASLQAVTGK